MTNHWVDIKNADLVFVMGGNPAEAHPCGFKWVIEAKKNRKAKLVVVDPRFNRTASVSDFYAPIRPGSDIAFLGGVINYLLANDKIHHDYVKAYTNASFLINDGFNFDDGIFTGYNDEKRSYDKATWSYQMGADGFVKVDETLQDPRCAFQLLKTHYSRYTPEMVAKVCGTPKEAFLKVCEYIAETAAPNKTMTNLYALGWTEHSVGSQNIRCMAIIQLLLGNMGMAGGGINALRGHANVQGITDFALYAQNLPGYLAVPSDAEPDLKTFLEKKTPKMLRPGQMNYGQHLSKWYVSLHKAWWGDAATKDNGYAYDFMPKLAGASDVLSIFDQMYQGKIHGFLCQGFNPLASVANKKKVSDGLSRLKYMVVMDPLATDTSEFWKPHGEFNDVDPAAIQTEVFRLPTTLFAETSGSFTNSGRVIQWRWKSADGPGDAKDDTEIMASLFLKLKEMYAKDGGAYAEPIEKLTWAYRIANKPSPEELMMEFNGKALADVTDPKDPTKVLVKAGDQLPSFAMLRDDGSTTCGNWIYCGVWSPAGNNSARRDNSDPSGLGQTLNWGFAWPVNRRILYNRASADPAGKPWDPKRTVMKWGGKAWVGNDVPDMRPDAAPEENVMPFIMTGEGVGRLFSLGLMNEGPFPEHYEPFESPLAANPMHPQNPKARANPAARVYKGDMEAFGTAKDFPYVGTTYRLTEHFHYWTKQSQINAIMQPEQFVEIGEELAKEKGIVAGDRVKVRSNRGFIKAVAVVTKRIKALDVDGRKVHTIGIPIHYGFKGATKPGFITNTLTPFVGDANTQTPEYKAFLVNVEKL
ncbi:MAG: formate dehydrogenase-N subunit alpha [Candidatus Accumulibacter sp. 66-26]|nr:MAG: formate dehydrogenase-N subunit alpha [Candidatus Accumulibacter sp. 66-26]